MTLPFACFLSVSYQCGRTSSPLASNFSVNRSMACGNLLETVRTLIPSKTGRLGLRVLLDHDPAQHLTVKRSKLVQAGFHVEDEDNRVLEGADGTAGDPSPGDRFAQDGRRPAHLHRGIQITPQHASQCAFCRRPGCTSGPLAGSLAGGFSTGWAAGLCSHFPRSSSDTRCESLAPQLIGNWSAALIARLLLLQPPPKPWRAPCGSGAPTACGSPAMESPSVSLHSLCNKHSLEFGRGTKDSRTPRKFSNARAIP